MCAAAEDLVQDPRLRLEEELPHDPDDDRRHRPGNEGERASQPAALQLLAQQEREPEREAEADRRHGDRPDQADLERVDEEVVLEQRAEVVEPDEVRRDLETGLRVGEAEVDPAHERDDAEDHDRQQRRDQQQHRLPAGEARRRRGCAPRRRPAGRPRGRCVMTPLPTRRGRRGAARRRRMRGSRARPSIRSSSSSAAIRAALGRAEVDRGRASARSPRRASCCPSRPARRRAGTSSPASRSAESAPIASRSFAQKIASGSPALEQALGRAPARLDHEVGGDLDQRVVAREPARAEPVEVAEAARRPGRCVLRPVDERDPPPPGRVQVPHGLRQRPCASRRGRVSTGVPFVGRPITITGAAARRSSSA